VLALGALVARSARGRTCATERERARDFVLGAVLMAAALIAKQPQPLAAHVLLRGGFFVLIALAGVVECARLVARIACERGRCRALALACAMSAANVAATCGRPSRISAARSSCSKRSARPEDAIVTVGMTVMRTPSSNGKNWPKVDKPSQFGGDRGAPRAPGSSTPRRRTCRPPFPRTSSSSMTERYRSVETFWGHAGRLRSDRRGARAPK